MEYTIQNDDLTVTVNQTGMELSSIRSVKNGIEYLWQGNPEIWGSQAPVLFPVIGALKNGRYIFDGKSYEMPKHGFIRDNDKIKVVEYSDNSILLSFSSSEESFRIYPFSFRFMVRFSLFDDTLITEHLIINTGDRPLYYSTGGHPAFNCPLRKGEKYEDYFIRFEKPETLSTCRLNSEGLISGKQELILNDTDELLLHDDLFNRDALIFKDPVSNKVSLINRTAGPVLTMSFKDFPSLGIWAKPGAPYICLEPWAGIADHQDTDQQLTNKEGILKLDAGSEISHVYRVVFYL
ncbi:aldose 1-epimerase family protein [Balneola sp. MJW-20]|uniref:aldose 1-epimerase family protein n=1 Tax=Gracilimonas aurantiaca TaxID=3234185 RepID=UPI003467BA83